MVYFYLEVNLEKFTKVHLEKFINTAKSVVQKGVITYELSVRFGFD